MFVTSNVCDVQRAYVHVGVSYGHMSKQNASMGSVAPYEEETSFWAGKCFHA